MKHYYICYMYLGDPEQSENWAQYVRYSNAAAFEQYNKWLNVSKDDITGFGITEVNINPVTGETFSLSLAHHVNPLPKKVIYNEVKGLKPKQKAPIAYEEEPVPPPPDIVNWNAIHQAFANQA